MPDSDERVLTRFSWAPAATMPQAPHAPVQSQVASHTYQFAQHLPVAVSHGGNPPAHLGAMAAVPAYNVVAPAVAAALQPHHPALHLPRVRLARHDGMVGIAVGLMVLILPVSGAVMMGMNQPAAAVPKVGAPAQVITAPVVQPTVTPVADAAHGSMPPAMNTTTPTATGGGDVAAQATAAAAARRRKLNARKLAQWRRAQQLKRASARTAALQGQQQAAAAAAFRQQQAQAAAANQQAQASNQQSSGGGGSTGGGSTGGGSPQVQSTPQPAATTTASS